MLKNERNFLIALLSTLFCFTLTINAQTDSPYSRYGFGKLRDQAVGPSKGMGGVGYALHTNQSANPMNPASYSQVDSLTFIFDIGVSYTRGSFTEGANSTSKSSGGLDYITMLFPIGKKMGISLGVLPFSSTGYKLGTTETVTDDDGREVQYRINHEGSGGLSQVYLGLGYQLPVKGLTVGANVSYLFGNLTYINAITAISETSNLTSQYTNLNVTTAKFDIGLQYKMALEKYSTLTFGAVYTPQIKSKAKLERRRSSDEEPVLSQNIDAGTPHMAGFGVAYNKDERLLIAADITYQKWKGVKFSDLFADDLTSANRFNNRFKVAAGAEYRASYMSKNYLARMKFRGGVNFSNSYVNVNTTEKVAKGYDEYGASLGFGLPVTDVRGLGRRTSYVNITLEYKYLKPKLNSMVKEKYFGITFNMNVNELWFLQRKIQ